MIVLLADGTVGETSYGNVDDTVTVHLHDENSLPIEVSGRIVEILA